MADPTTLKALADSDLALWESRLVAARAESAAAQTAVDEALADQSDATQALAGANAESARVRAALAAIPTTADAGPLLTQLDAATVAARAAESAILAAERDLALTRARLVRAGLAARTAEQGRGLARTGATDAGIQETRGAALAAALTAPPLDTLVQDATDLLASQTAADAKTAAEKDFPAALLTRARSRVAIALERMENSAASRDAFAALIAAQTAATGSTADKLAAPRMAYDTALAALEGYVGSARMRFERAEAALIRLADPAQKAVFTPAQIARLNDAALAADRAGAADLELDLDEATRDRDLAAQERDLERVKRDTGLPDDLAAKETALTSRQSALDAAELAYTAAERTLLSQWEAAAPDWAWTDLGAYEDAIATLHDLADHPPGPLATDRTAKESALVAALLVLGRERTARDLYTAELAARNDSAAFEAGAASRIAFAALRGDG